MKVYLIIALVIVFSCKSVTQVGVSQAPADNESTGMEEVPQNVESAPKVAAYTETIAGTEISFDMVPVPAGTFLFGSPANEVGRQEDEGPQREVAIDAFWMMSTEATWDLFEIFIDKEKSARVDYANEEVKVIADAVTRPSTPYLDPSFRDG